MTTDWTHFEHKLALGKTLDEAASELGLSPDIIRERYDDERQATSVYGLEATGAQAIKVALATLQDVCTHAKEDVDRVTAAGHLLKFATAAMRAANDKRRTATEKKTASGMIDLFDVAGDWVLKKPGV